MVKYIEKVLLLFPNSSYLIAFDPIKKGILEVQSRYLKKWRKRLVILDMID